MADIKTRNAVEGRVKTIDRALIAGQHIKQSYLSTRDESLRYAGTSKNTEVEYATNQVEQKAEEVAMDGVHKAGIPGGGILKLQGTKILLQNHKSLLPYGYPFAYVENIHHQYILIFRKEKK